jgi:hypothetical protein
MARRYFIAIAIGALLSSLAPALHAQAGVPARYAGDWVCQTTMPGYNILLPSADPSQPLTNKATTPPTVAVVKFSLSTNGTYQTPTEKGHYRFDSKTKAVTWLDGPHEKTFTKTELSDRANGAPAMGLVLNGRYYGCFVAKAQP